MNYREYKPTSALAPYVKCVWMLDGMTTGSRERILPDGCIELIFNYGDPYTQHIGHADKCQPFSFIHGQLAHFIEISSSGVTGILGVRFHPFGLSAFVRCSVDAFTQSVVTLEDVFGKTGRQLEQMLLNERDDEGRLAVTNSFLFRQMEVRNRVDAIAAAADLIAMRNGNVAAIEVAKHACMSERQLERRFREMVGLTPKRFARIARLQHSLRLLNVAQPVSISQLAYTAGYYDPAHFVRDFTDLSGVTPAAYFSSVHNMSDLFTAT